MQFSLNIQSVKMPFEVKLFEIGFEAYKSLFSDVILTYLASD